MKILVINAGSSSIKFKLFNLPQGVEVCQGVVERIGEEEGKFSFLIQSPDGTVTEDAGERRFVNHRLGLKRIADFLFDQKYQILRSPQDIQAVGHRIVHGGEIFKEPVLIEENVVEHIRSLIPLAPLHNPGNLEGMLVAREVFPEAKQVAVFDTAYHQSLPPCAYHYAIPVSYYQDHGIRVYGMHGTSHQYVAEQAALHLGTALTQLNLITVHLGNGCSMTAIKNGKSIDTSMGFSPLAGLIMGTRSGDIDPAVTFFMARELGMSYDDIDRTLNKESGLKGIAGSNDVRDILRRQEDGDPDAQLATDMYTYRIKKYIGAYMAVLGRLDVLVFTAGVGENSPFIRSKACQDLAHLGIRIDEDMNRKKGKGMAQIQSKDSRVKILVVPTNEELAIAEQTRALISSL